MFQHAERNQIQSTPCAGHKQHKQIQAKDNK